MECTKCGACCRFVGISPGFYVTIKETELNTIPEQLREKAYDGWRMKAILGKHCIAFDPNTNLCTIHEKRPDTCRRHVGGSNVCVSIREHVKNGR